jgi:hypothetical protein
MSNPDPNQEWSADRILKEKEGYYYISWAGIDPDTSKPWRPTWEPKNLANEALVMEWREKKKSSKKKSSRRNRKQSRPCISSTTRGKSLSGKPHLTFHAFSHEGTLLTYIFCLLS